jgi:hypothetical protein
VCNPALPDYKQLANKIASNTFGGAGIVGDRGLIDYRGIELYFWVT